MFHESGGEEEFEDTFGWSAEGEERYFAEPTLSSIVTTKPSRMGVPSDTSTPKTAAAESASLPTEGCDASSSLPETSTNQSQVSGSGFPPKPTNPSAAAAPRGTTVRGGRGRGLMSRDQGRAWSAKAATLEDVRVALSKGNVGKISEFLESGLDPNTQLKSGWTILLFACDKADDVMVELLLSQGADPNTHTDQFTALMAVCACKTRREEFLVRTAQLLVDKKARINAHDRHHMSPLLYAVQNGRNELVGLLLSAGADVNKEDTQGWTPVFYAAAKGDVLLMQLLVDAGANPAAECAYGETPSVVAYSNEHVAAADWLDGITSSSSQKGAPRSIARGIERSSHTESSTPAGASLKAVSTDGFVRYGDLELFLTGIKLGDLVPLFRQHQLQFSDLLSVTDRDLEQMGVTQVGVRKRLLDSILEVHKREWDMPKEAVPLNRTISGPEAAVILSNLARHAHYVRGTAVFLQQHIQSDPDVLDSDMEPVEADRLTGAVAETVAAVDGLRSEVTALQRSIHTAFRLPPPESGEVTRVTPASAVRRTLRLAAMIGGVALVGGAVYFSGRQLLSRFSKL